MFAGLALWVVAFYLPYAWFTLTFNYSYGQDGLTLFVVVLVFYVTGSRRSVAVAHLHESTECRQKPWHQSGVKHQAPPSNNHGNREEPGFVAGMTFSMVVVAGNALMYLATRTVILQPLSSRTIV